jgi:N-acyl-D-aspartate/D-glutamate deacylase
MYDLVIRGGMIVDGTGKAPFTGDIAILGGRIAAVGDRIDGPAKTVIDAGDKIVTPGFVDVHTHYDGQATWDEQLAPSCWHGVTTVVVGNCGVGFAPVRPGTEQALIQLMEGVEDIPGTVLAEGISWGWESFPEYLDILSRRRWMIDVGTHVPHAAVRAYVMGNRANDDRVTQSDLEQMTAIVRAGVQAGALGISTSRILAHRTSTGDMVPGTLANRDELAALADVLRELGTGVFEVVPRGMDGEATAEAHAEIDWMGEIAAKTGRPVVFSLVQTHTELDRWQELLSRSGELRDMGISIYPQVANRPTGILFGLESPSHPFSTRPTYRALSRWPLRERVARMRDVQVRAKILSETNGAYDHPLSSFVYTGFGNMLPVAEPINFEPKPSDTIAALAESAGVSPEEYCYDFLTGAEGRNLLMFPFTNYFRFNLNDVHAMLTHPASVYGLGDGGAHCGIACDASGQTFMLAYWVRDRKSGPRIPLEQAVKTMTSDNADLYGLHDRGRIVAGYRADIAVIDFDRLKLQLPQMVYDLPAGGRRVMQRARGYSAVIVNGEITIRDDLATGALPGRLIRGAQPAPI